MNRFQQILTQYWGYSGFRPMQEDIIRMVADQKKDTLGLLPTGGGKSIIFQVPALATEGICLVITPLIALMKDQVENLKKRKIKAAAIFSGLNSHEIDIILDNCIYGGYKFLYVSPERLGSELFKVRLEKMNVNLLAVDEAHCISQWGYDFRPSYLKIAEIREMLPHVPVLALTATATPEVVIDIQNQLKFREHNLLKKSFERRNLVYIVRETEDKQKMLLQLLNQIKGTAVVYARSRKKTVDIARFLHSNGVSADFYHAGLSGEVRDKKQNLWMQDKCRVIVATNAFGMGIDKPEVRIVVHVDVPDSLEAYFQEAGRGGRDEKKAYAYLLYHPSDKINLERNFLKSFPEKEVIVKVYNALGNYLGIPIGAGKGQAYDFRIFHFAKTFNLESITIYHCLKILQGAGYLELTEEINTPSKVYFLVQRDQLYKFQVANAAYDGFIKLLLRSYTGLFTDYVKISEYSLAQKAKVETDLVVKYLKVLDDAGIIKYLPQKKVPLVIYTEERLESKSLVLSKESYEFKKERARKKLGSVLEYVESHNKCRSQILLSYFGEKNSYRCGECDVCNKRNELELSKYEFDMILNEVKEELQKNPLPMEQLIDKINFPKEKIIRVLQWLLDNRKVILQRNNTLRWH